MIGVYPILRLVELAVWSTAIAGERNPVSILLVARPESGKTDIIEHFMGSPNTIMVNDLTAWGLSHKVLPFMQKNGSKATLLIPDLLNLLSRNQSTVITLVQTLKTLMEEGITAIHTKFIDVQFEHPVTGAVITSVTPSEFGRLRKAWTKNGVLSRFIVVSYSYSPSSREAVHSMLQTKLGVPRDGQEPVRLPREPMGVRINPELLEPLKALALSYIASMGMKEESWGFRAQLHFQRLAAAHALSTGRNVVRKDDVDSVCALLRLYANLDYTQL